MADLTTPAGAEKLLSGMSTQEFLELLKDRHVVAEAREGRLKISAPAGVLDAGLKAELKARKEVLLETLGRAALVEEEGPGLVPLSDEQLRGRIPLTPAQQGMWLIDHFSPGNIAYNIPEAFRVEQAIELETIQSAVDRLIGRHSILRASIHEEDGELFQTVHDSVDARVGFTDLSLLHEKDKERRCAEVVRSLGREPFDLKKAPLVRFHLIRLAAGLHVVFLNIHHIIADRVSLYVMREELAAFFMAEQGREVKLPELELQFVDYAAWISRQMRSKAIGSETIGGQIAYWRKKLEGLPASLELPHSRPRPEKRSYRGATLPVFVTAETRAALSRIGMEEGASPFITFLALFAVTVARWSQVMQAEAVDFCIGSPITHRKNAATRRMIGLFVNMLAFRCQIAPGMSFREVLRQVRGTALEAYENSDVPFQRLVREINPDRRSQRSPFFQVMFGYETYLPMAADASQMDADPGTARYDLSLHLSEMTSEGLAGGLTGLIEYCTDLFTDEDIRKLAAEGEAVSAGVVREPDLDVFGVARAAGASEIAETAAREEARRSSRSMSATARRMNAALNRVGRMLSPKR